MYGMVQQGIISDVDRLSSFFSNMMAMFLPYSWLPEVANLAAYKQKTFGAGGGGLISMYWYVFLGILGPLIIGVVFSYIVRLAVYSKNAFVNIYCILVLSTYLRWFAYNQISLFKITLYGSLFYIILLLIKDIIRSNNQYNTTS